MNEELKAAIESLRNEMLILHTEYMAGLKPIYQITVNLLAGEHFHAAGPVLSSLPIDNFGASLEAFKSKFDKLAASAAEYLPDDEVEEEEEFNDSGDEVGGTSDEE